MKLNRFFFLFLFAIAVRLVYVAIDSKGLGEIDPRMDSYGYHSYAVNLLDRGSYETADGFRAWRTPGYPIFIAFIYSISGRSILAVQIAQCFISALTCILIVIAAKRLVPPPWPWIAGCGSALYYNMFAGCPRLLTEPLYIFFIALFFATWLVHGERTNVRYFISGLIVGTAGLVRPEAWILGGLLISLVFLRRPSVRGLFMACWFFLGVAPFQTTWMVRNYRVFHRLVPTTTHVGAYYYYAIQRPLTELHMAPVESLDIPPTDEIETDRIFHEKAKQVYRDTPWPVILKIWLYGLVVMTYPFHPWYDWTLIFFLPFVLFGMASIFIRRNHLGITPAVYILVGTALYILVGGVGSRYQEPLAPGTLLVAIIGLSYFFEKYGQNIFKKVVSTWLSSNLILWIGAPFVRRIILNLKGHIW